MHRLLKASLLLASLSSCGDRPELPSEAPWNTALDRSRHGYFPIDGAAPHAATDCDGCHGAFDTFTRFSCIGCHSHAQDVTAADHAGVTGFTYTGTSCIQCHPTGEAIDVNHALIFPIAAGADHEGVRCAECHVDPASRATLGCTKCHGGSAALEAGHASVGGYAFESRACIRCHGDSQVDEVIQHLPFLIRSGAPHFRQSCVVCHPAFRADKVFAADFVLARAACGPCHTQTAMDDKHKAMGSYTYAPASCLQAGCHPDGTKD